MSDSVKKKIPFLQIAVACFILKVCFCVSSRFALPIFVLLVKLGLLASP